MHGLPSHAAWIVVALFLPFPMLAAAVEIAPEASAIAPLIESHRIVLLGEVHDNPVQHALRAKALAQALESGKRPALAFEQFDTERQADIDRARREKPGDADHLIAEARGRGNWNWEYYRPFVQLALQYDLPIVAANLSRQRASEVATTGWQVVFDERARHDLKLDALPAEFLGKHAIAIQRGHCNALPTDAIPAMARAQIARDVVMAQALQPHADRGVVLLAGNGHVRNDIGVPFWLSSDERRDSVAVGALERSSGNNPDGADMRYDAWFVTAAAERADPCKNLGSMPTFGRSEAREAPRN